MVVWEDGTEKINNEQTRFGLMDLEVDSVYTSQEKKFAYSLEKHGREGMPEIHLEPPVRFHRRHGKQGRVRHKLLRILQHPVRFNSRHSKKGRVPHEMLQILKRPNHRQAAQLLLHR